MDEERRDEFFLAFDIHGRLVHCASCGCELEDISVNHYKRGKPQCDVCYWEEYYDTHDED